MAKDRTLNEYRQTKDYGYNKHYSEKTTAIGDLDNKYSVIEFENYIFPEILKLQKKYPNDADLGKHVRRLLNNNNQNTMFPGPQNL